MALEKGESHSKEETAVKFEEIKSVDGQELIDLIDNILTTPTPSGPEHNIEEGVDIIDVKGISKNEDEDK